MTRQRIAITGSSGLIGGALSAYLRERGDTVVRLVRRHPVGPQEARFIPGDSANAADLREVLGSVDAVVNLAGAGLADHLWTERYKRVLHDSRVETTTHLVRAMAGLDVPVRLVSGSAIGFYGDRGDEVLDERSAQGSGFLTDLVVAWEDAAAAASREGHPVALARTGVVASAQGGAFAKLALPARLGLSGPLGSGQQWWSWISLRDEVRALVHLIDDPAIVGPVNLVAPRASRQVDLARALGRSLMRPAVLPVPAVALKKALGDMSASVLDSTRVRPTVLTEHGFSWLDANQDQLLDRIAADLTGRSKR